MIGGSASARAFGAWAVMVALTVMGWLLVEETGAVRLAASAAILVAGIKITLVIARFMEVGWQPRPWRLVLTVWTLAVMAIILGAYWGGAYFA